jgi:acyl-CoA reductase-like NAD-dependent aldehyde dehydrogenase
MADSPRDIETKIANAAAAQEEWGYSTFADRKRVMKSLKRWLVENQDVCARVAARDSGKTCKLAGSTSPVRPNDHVLTIFMLVLDAGLGEILVTAAKLDWMLDHGTRVLRPETRYSSLLTIYKHSEVHFEPLGVVAALVSWNYRTYYTR